MPIKKIKSLDKLLEAAKWGKLSDEEVAYVVKSIEECKPHDDDNLYTLIHTLGKAGIRYTELIKYKKLIESFLSYPTEPMISKIALQTLCSYWNFTEQYLDKVNMFIKGVEWDKDENVRIIAMSIAGQFCRTKPNKELLTSLIDIFENPREDDFIRRIAYESLADAIGREWNEIPGAKNSDLSIIEEAKSFLQKKKKKKKKG